MSDRKKYQKRASSRVVAVQLNLDTEGFTYKKWKGIQTCKPGDWLVDNDGDIYSVDGKTFARTYRPISQGLYVKATPIWAEVALTTGKIKTKEGVTHYEAGDYIVYDKPEGGDGYAISTKKFREMYEPAK